ncbi:MAG: helix-turn-helix domain-containing protein [Leptotrichia wadei]|uniref:helix-turn-helix domain-containing protein n=1 Tax=Leptotrichia wadei TaxID=157687 RepID=UPI0026F01589|nr:helix-turn-helix domain-containing protein [Leptotrichia wadei]MBS6020434.1 helix-turn-helix domain-containing protein [Leptotrichia wadei]
MEKPNFYGIMPANVRYDKNLKPMEKILYTEITALSNKEGYCFASNSYFGELYEVNKKTVSTWVNNLEKQGYIKIVLIYKQGTKEITERRIYINQKVNPVNKNVDTYPQKNGEVSIKKSIGYPQKNGDPIHKKMEDNNTSIILQDDVVKNINTTQKENETTKEIEQQHQLIAINLAKKELSKLCDNKFAIDAALLTHRYKIQTLYKYLGRDKFLETFEKIQESSYLREQAKKIGQFLNWLFSSKKENFLNVFNDVYADKDKNSVNNSAESVACTEANEDNFDFSMWEVD